MRSISVFVTGMMMGFASLLCPTVQAGDAAGRAESSTPLWYRWEGEFRALADTSPKTQLSLKLTSPSGKQRTLQGFWDGGRMWRARVMPDEQGVWKYQTKSRPPVKGLDGIGGQFKSGPALGDSRFARHGAIRVAAAGTYLEHTDGTPFFWLGDTVWNGPILSTKSDWTEYLHDRVAKKFTVVQHNAVAPWRTAATDELGQVAFTSQNHGGPIELNPAYFQRLDQRINAINNAGLVAAHVLIWSLTDHDPGKYLSEEDVIQLVEYQIARYGAHHLVWILAGDNRYNEQTTSRWKRVGRAVFGDGPHAPVTTHPTGVNWPWEDWRDEQWLDILGYQSGHGDSAKSLAWIHSGPVHRNWRHHKKRPIINLEPPYEDIIAYQSRKPHLAYNVRRAVYWSLLCAPTAGITYGGHGMWSWQTVEDVALNHERFGVAKVWHEAKDLPGAFDMQRMAEFFTSERWWTLKPAGELLGAQPGREDPSRFVAVSRSDDGDLVVAYLPVGGEVAFSQSITELGLGSMRWFDPRTGRFEAAKPRDGRWFTAPDNTDWMLVLKR